MTTTVIDKKKNLLKRFHTVCSKNGLKSEDKTAICMSYGVRSSKDLDEMQLAKIINKLDSDGDVWRKRVMAAIGGWLNAVNIDQDAKTIKGIACRSAGYKYFNGIPVSRLRSIYYEFRNKSKTSQNAQAIKNEIISSLQISN